MYHGHELCQSSVFVLFVTLLPLQNDTIGIGPVPPGYSPPSEEYINDVIEADMADRALANFVLEELPALLEEEADRIARQQAIDDAWYSQRFEGDVGDDFAVTS